ncbi:10586_t:CDS:2 [Funneliformis geosporum]|uniref:NADH dehydrogenase [ubiquinone] 1 beta subcomplex subunit 9 n=1 Tax=Funneliformis geosporum TaxID=1117311 RepID=A0A9W4SJ83_9GLOM|nr:10586_t:CDS:2 [Funneliformis geosporum]CAI2171057.1 3236_t:CDS:2 [Funneliformis geosporum]
MLQPAFPVVHKQYVTSLYRRSLKTALDWYVNRSAWRSVALDIRARFEANKNVASLQDLRKILHDTEKELENYNPTAPDGSKWERNIPPPLFAEETYVTINLILTNLINFIKMYSNH